MTREEAIKELERISEDTVQRDCSTCGRHTAGTYNGVCCYCSLCQVVPEIFRDYHDRKHFRSHWKWNGEWKNEALDMAIAALREQPRWISVDERLPEDWAIVQIVEDNGYVWLPKIGEYRHGRNQWFVEGCFEASHGWLEDEKMFHVTHWMPLPEPPEVEV